MEINSRNLAIGLMFMGAISIGMMAMKARNKVHDIKKWDIFNNSNSNNNFLTLSSE